MERESDYLQAAQRAEAAEADLAERFALLEEQRLNIRTPQEADTWMMLQKLARREQRELVVARHLEGIHVLPEYQPKRVVADGLVDSLDPTENADGVLLMEEMGFVGVVDGNGPEGTGASARDNVLAHLTRGVVEFSQAQSVGEAEHIMRRVLEGGQPELMAMQAETGQRVTARLAAIKLHTNEERQYAVIGRIGDCAVLRLRHGKLKAMMPYPTRPGKKRWPALGKRRRHEATIRTFRAEPGDAFLVTTNGLPKNERDVGKLSKVTRQAGGNLRTVIESLANKARASARSQDTISLAGIRIF